jgi:hypothetical protein
MAEVAEFWAQDAGIQDALERLLYLAANLAGAADIMDPNVVRTRDVR